MATLQPKNIPLSLYIHFPWCVRKCPYCDFNSHTLKDSLPEEDYIDALIRDFRYELSQLDCKRTIQSIFLGGGTPSLFSGQAIKRLFQEIQNEIDFAENIEITLEANPGAIEHDNFEYYVEAGINRISLGAQSFSPQHLHTIGRIHQAEDTDAAVAKLKRAGITNYNLDLMFCLPNQTPEQAVNDLKRALSLQPNHLSLYQFTLEPNTYFSKYPPPLPDSDAAFEMQQSLLELTQQHGFHRYEVSAYSLENQHCRHNQNYWLFGDYIGIGAGAHGKTTSSKNILRTQKIKHPSHYLEKSQQAHQVRLSQPVKSEDILFEYLMNALRLTQGFNFNETSERTGLTPSYLVKKLQPYFRQELLQQHNQVIKCTDKGYLFIDSILQSLLQT